MRNSAKPHTDAVGQTVSVELIRERVAAIQRETKRPGDPYLILSTIDAMCEAILNPDFAEEIGVDPTLPCAEVTHA